MPTDSVALRCLLPPPLRNTSIVNDRVAPSEVVYDLNSPTKTVTPLAYRKFSWR